MDARRIELRPEGTIGTMPRHPDRLWRGLEPHRHLCVGIALRIPCQEEPLAGGHPRQHGRNVLRRAHRAVGLEPLLLRVCGELLPFAAAALPLLGNRMLEGLPKVGQGVFEGSPVEKDLQLGGIDQGLGVHVR